MINLSKKEIIVVSNYTVDEIVDHLRMNVLKGNPSRIHLKETLKRFYFYGNFNKEGFKIRKLIDYYVPFKKRLGIAPWIIGTYKDSNNQKTEIKIIFEYPRYSYYLLLLIKTALVTFYFLFFTDNITLNEPGQGLMAIILFPIFFLVFFLALPITYMVKCRNYRKAIFKLLKTEKDKRR